MTIASRLLRAVCLATALAPFSAATEDDAGSPPNNVLVIMVDQLSARTVGCYDNGFGGVETSLTPSLDALAAEGVRFNNCYASDVPCLPSRSAFYSGRLGIHNGAVNHGGTSVAMCRC